MVGTHKFTVSDNKVAFCIDLRRNVTIIQGNGGTGKTRLFKFIQEASKRGSGVHITDTSDTVVAGASEFLEGNLQKYRGTNTIFIFDEDYPYFATNAFREAITFTGCYFILITRNSYSGFGVSTQEIYEMVHDKSASLNKLVYTLNPLYPGTLLGRPFRASSIVTEDSRAGYQLFSRRLGAQLVFSAGGKNNVASAIKKHSNCVAVVDGAAFGFELRDALEAANLHSSGILAFESFEYCILKSGIVSIPSTIDIDCPQVDYHRYLTWENYYTQLLQNLTQNTILQYSKDHLNSNYSAPGNTNKILKVYDPSCNILPLPPAAKTSFFQPTN